MTDGITNEEVEAYNTAHAAALKLQGLGSVIDLAWTMTSRLRVLLEDAEEMDYVPSDPLYTQANKIDHEISELLTLLLDRGLNVAPARYPMPPQRLS